MLAGMFFLTACATNPEPQNMEEPPSWSVGLTWGSTGSGATSYAHPVLLAGFTGTMDEASVFCCWYDPVSSTWQDGTPPVLDRYASLNLVAISCGETTKDLTSLPQSLVADASHQELWLMDYQAEATKGHVNLRLHHLMSQVGIRIQLEDEQLAALEPVDVTLRAYTQATVEYEEERLVPSGIPEQVACGAFTESGDFSGMWEGCSLLTVIPQTFRAGETCLTFRVDGNNYTFRPDKDITLTPGRITYLNLGVAYDRITLSIAEGGISVNGWGSGGDLSGGEAG